MNKLVLQGRITEMSAQAIKVPTASGVDLEKLTEGDPDPMFVTLEVASATVSGNRNRYSEATLLNIAEQINETRPDAYLGHLDDKELATKYPDPQTMWIGASVEKIDGVARLFAKGYVYTDAKVRSLLKKAVAAGKVMAVSIAGRANKKFDKVAKVYDIIDFKLDSIDWARPGTQGLNPLLTPFITQEMVDTSMEIKLQEATLEQLKELRPDLVEALKKELTPTPPANPEPTPAPAPTAEMVEVKNLLGLDENGSVKERVSEMVDENKTLVSEMKDLLTEHIDLAVGQKVTKPAVKAVIKEMVVNQVTDWTKSGVDTAINNVLQSKSTTDLITEMTREMVVNPLEDPRNSGTSKTNKFIKK